MFDWLTSLVDCLTKRCDYHRYYLAQGPAELTHLGYHSATKRYLDAQMAAQDFWDRHERECPQLLDGRPCCHSTGLDATARHWEDKVRA